MELGVDDNGITSGDVAALLGGRELAWECSNSNSNSKNPICTMQIMMIVDGHVCAFNRSLISS